MSRITTTVLFVSFLAFTSIALTGCGEDNHHDDHIQSTDMEDDNFVFIWSGDWSVEYSYNVDCDQDGYGTRKAEDRHGLLTIAIHGENDDLETNLNDQTLYAMKGKGDNTRLSLTGSFPLQATGDDKAGTDSEIIIILEELVDANQAKGEMTGTFDTETVTDCKLSNTAVRFFR